MLFLGYFSVILCLISSQYFMVLTEEVSSVNSLLELLYSTINACGHVQWCTIQTEIPDGVQPTEGCCFHCSCSKKCLQEKNCCPDYRLRNLLRDKLFSNVSKFTSELDKIGNISRPDIEINYERKNRVADKTLDCVRSQLFDGSPFRPPSTSYRMITTCSNIRVNAGLREKCENIKISTNSSVTDYLPTQSMESGIVYRNTYCHQCSDEPNARALKWDLLVACFQTPTDLLMNQIQSMTYMLMYMFQMIDKKKLYGCNIFFEPGTVIRKKHLPAVCTKIDVKSCRNEIVTNINTSDVCRKERSIPEAQNVCRNETDISRHVVNACQNYLLPVHVLINGKLTTFNNIACLSCRGLVDYSNLCHAFHKWQNIVPFLGRIQAHYFDEKDPKGSPMKVPDVTDRPTLPCGRGYVYDSFQTQCRKLYCPCGMIEYMTTCVPVFEDIQGKTYLIQIFITVRKQQDDKQRNFESKLFNYFSNSIETNLRYRVKYVGLLKAPVQENNGKMKYIANLYFAAEIPDVTFLETLKTVGNLFRGQKVIEAGTDLNADMVLKNVDIVGSKGGYSIVFQNGSVDQIPSSETLVIKECNFCRRVELLPNDIKTHSDGIFVSNTGYNILRADIARIITNITRLVVCARYVIGTTQEGKDFVASQNPEIVRVKKPDPVENSENWQKSNGFLYCIIALVVIACLVYRLLHYKKSTRLQEQPNINHIELSNVNMATFDP